jgi:hypothetical protein
MNDANKKKLRNELDTLMQGFGQTFGDGTGTKDASELIGKKLDEIAKPAKQYDFDMDELDKQFKVKAQLLINSMFDFYLDADVIDKIEYTKRKRDLDTSNISNMLWQLKTVKITISILMDEITSGNTNPKTIAALSDMQDRFSEIMRMQANYVIFLEDTYKKMKYETADAETDPDRREMKALGKAREEADDSDYFLTANPKELIRQITEVTPLSEEEHAEMKAQGEDCISSDTGTKNTDPKLKEELMTERNIQVEKKDGGTEGYDSLLNMI